MSLTKYRQSELEQKRTHDLIELIKSVPDADINAIDIGARDGFFSKLLTNYYRNVTALDLEKPTIQHDNISCVQGDITKLEFDDNSFNLVFCAEVLEHIPPKLLEKSCLELARVSSRWVLIGVPYKQDIRVGRTTCLTCNTKNPPWGHVNSFNKSKLLSLFSSLTVKKISFVGENKNTTNFISTFLMDLAGNPYGTYTQDETCIKCGNKLKIPPERKLIQKILTKLAVNLVRAQSLFSDTRPNWIHILFEKQDT